MGAGNVKMFYKPGAGPNAGKVKNVSGGIRGGSHVKEHFTSSDAQITTFYSRASGVTDGMRVNTPAIGRARMLLKLQAMAYERALVFARPDDPKAQALVRIALEDLSKAAINYVESLNGGTSMGLVDRDLECTQRLQLAALAYVGSRGGYDANPAFSNAGIALLCQVSIRYVEDLGYQGEIRNDDTLHLDNGG